MLPWGVVEGEGRESSLELNVSSWVTCLFSAFFPRYLSTPLLSEQGAAGPLGGSLLKMHIHEQARPQSLFQQVQVEPSNLHFKS